MENYPLRKRRPFCGNGPLILKSLTMIDPVTGWFEIVQYSYKQASTIKNLVKKTWLCRYPLPTRVKYNRGNEFLSHAWKNELIKKNMELNASAQLWRIHKQTQYQKYFTNSLRTSYVNLTQKIIILMRTIPWSRILAAMYFVIRNKYHTTPQATPDKLVFGRSMILNNYR